MNYELIAYGDGKPTSRRCRKSPGQLKAVFEQPYGATEIALMLQVYPSNGRWELLGILGSTRYELAAGTLNEQGANRTAPTRG